MTDAPPDLLIDTLGVTTRAWRYGDAQGEPIVLVHGFRGDHHGLETIAQALVEWMPSLCAIVPDLPGFGATPAIPEREHDLDLYGEWLRAFTDAVAPAARVILGHSFGSLVVTNALSQGLEASAVVLINPISAPALAGPQAFLTQLAIAYYRAADLLPERAARALLGSPAIVRVMSEVMAKTGDRELRRWIHDQHHRYFSNFANTTTLLQAFRASVSHTVMEYASAVQQPTLLIVGDRDDITPLTTQVALSRRIADASLRVMPGVGHLVHYEGVHDAVSYVGEFLATHFAEGAGEQA